MKPSQLYFLAELEAHGCATVLDFACSKGGLWEHVPNYIDIYGCDLQLSPEMAERIADRKDRFRLSGDPAKIPYPDAMFDLVFANSAFEHVHPIEEIVGECARVLKPHGRLIAVFPCKSTIIEPHCHVPFASWMPSGRGRQAWLYLWYSIFSRSQLTQRANRHVEADRYLAAKTNYLTYRRYMKILGRYFNLRDVSGELMRLKGASFELPGWFISRFYAVAVDATKR